MTSSEQLMAPETAAATVTTKLLAQEITKDVQVCVSYSFKVAMRNS
jgi:hypothetical protein